MPGRATYDLLVTLRVPRAMWDEVGAVARIEAATRSQFVRDAITDALAKRRGQLLRERLAPYTMRSAA